MQYRSDLINKINLAELDILVAEVKPRGMAEEYAARVEEMVFTAYYDKNEIGHITIDRYVKPTKKELQDEFFSDNNFKPQRPRPWLFFMKVEPEYRGMGIAETLIKFANEFYQSKYETPLHSGTSNLPNAIRVWEKLVESKDAVEYVYDNKRRWRLV